MKKVNADNFLKKRHVEYWMTKWHDQLMIMMKVSMFHVPRQCPGPESESEMNSWSINSARSLHLCGGGLLCWAGLRCAETVWFSHKVASVLFCPALADSTFFPRPSCGIVRTLQILMVRTSKNWSGDGSGRGQIVQYVCVGHDGLLEVTYEHSLVATGPCRLHFLFSSDSCLNSNSEKPNYSW